MKSSARTRSRTRRTVERSSCRSDSIWRGASGRCTLTTTSSPFGSVARCTCPIEAAAIGVSSNVRNARSTVSPRSASMTCADLLERDRRDVVLELAQLGDDVRWHQVGAGREQLAELDERRPELVEHLPQPPPAFGDGHVRRRAAPVEHVAEAVTPRDAGDLGETADRALARSRHAVSVAARPARAQTDTEPTDPRARRLRWQDSTAEASARVNPAPEKRRLRGL